MEKSNNRSIYRSDEGREYTNTHYNPLTPATTSSVTFDPFYKSRLFSEPFHLFDSFMHKFVRGLF